MTLENQEIKSRQNPQYKALKKISQGKSDSVFIEGGKLFNEALNSSLKIEKIYIDEDNYKTLLLNRNVEVAFMNNNLLSSLFTTDSKPTRNDLIVALAKRPTWSLKDLYKNKRNLVFLENIQDPGNLGMIFRSVLAFNAGGILLSKDSVDPFNTKVIRASAGAVFSVPFVTITQIKDFKLKGYKIIGTSSNKSTKKLNELNINSSCLYLFGNEGAGLSKELLDFSDDIISIPHESSVESLNLGVTVSIFLWEIYKRRFKGPKI